MPTETRPIEYQVCYGVYDRVTFANGVWLGADIPEAKRKPKDAEACPLMWEFLAGAGAEGWELVAVLESPGARGALVRTYFLKRPGVAAPSRASDPISQRPS